MEHGEFIWCDLSAFDKEKAQSFYGRIFGWQFQPLTNANTDEYAVASTGHGETAGVFTMPEKLQKIGLPSFWMSYIAVEDIVHTVAMAEQYGGKVEIGPIPFDENGEIALIRDPLGAGFTVYSGLPISANEPRSHGHRVGHQLYVSDAAKVIPFYEALFSWGIKDFGENTYEIKNAAGELISHIHEMPETKRGKFEFWGVEFVTNSHEETKRTIEEVGGKCGYEDGNLALYYDLDGAGFFTKEIAQTKLPEPREPLKWKSLLGLALIAAAILFELDGIWGILFLLWTLPAFKTGRIYLLEEVVEDKNPVLFWVITLTWFVLSLFMIFAAWL